MKKIPTVNILGLQVSAITIQEARAVVNVWVRSPTVHAHCIVKPYVEFMIQNKDDKRAQDILNSAELCVPDGVSLQWGASFLYGKPDSKPTIFKLIRSAVVWIQKPSWLNQVLPERFAGINFTARMLDDAEKYGWRVGVIGGSRDTRSTTQALQARWPKLNLLGVWSGYSRTTTTMEFDLASDDKDFMAIINQISLQKLDVLFVAMGFPRQELFMNHYKDQLNAKVLVGEGGSFDYSDLGGSIKRAPKIFRSLNIEWLWRLLLQPKRFFRQLAIPRYTWRIYRAAQANWLRETMK